MTQFRWTIVASAGIACGSSPAMAQEDKPSVAVLVVGSSPSTVGKLQQTIESALAKIGRVRVVRAPEIVERLGLRSPPRAPTRNPSTTLRADLDAAMEATRRGDSSLASGALARARSSLGNDLRTTHDARVELELSHVGLELANKNVAGARDFARRALRLAPDLKVDLERFWPSLAEFVEDVRGRAARPLVTVQAIPSGAKLWVNGRSVTSPFEVVSGQQVIVAEAAGHTPVRLELEVSSDTNLKMALPIALDVELRTSLPMGSSVENSEAMRARFEPIRIALGVDRLGLVRTEDDTVFIMMFDGRKEPRRSRDFPLADTHKLAEWFVKASRSADYETRAPTTSSPLVRLSRDSSWLVWLAASPVFQSDALSWSSSLVSVDRVGLSFSLGAGRSPPQSESGWVGNTDFSIELASFAEVSEKNLANQRLTSGGGTRAKGGIGGGYAGALGNRIEIVGQAWVSLESVRWSDVFSDGVGLGVLENYSRASGGVSFDVKARVYSRIFLDAHLRVGLLNTFIGDSSLEGRELASDGAVALGATHWRSRRWGIGVAARAEIATIEFSNAGESTAEPTPNNAKRDQFALGLGFVLLRRL